MEKEYKLHNRYPDNTVTLTQIEGNDYLLEGNNVNYYTVGNIEGMPGSGPIYSVDPEGGPCLFIDKDINQYIVNDVPLNRLIRIKKIRQNDDGNGFILTLHEVLNYDEFYNDIVTSANEIIRKEPWRFGQAVFNYTEKKYDVARIVQFRDGIDCFYSDSKVEDFIKAAYERYSNPLERR